jgi:uncharacterized protein (TIGR02231 family)
MKSCPVVLAVMLLIAPASIYAAEIQAESEIVSAVVYPDRALVTRVADVRLAEGEHVVVFSNLPSNIDPDSLQVKGEGEAGVHLLSTELKRNVLEQARSEEIARLETDIQQARDELAAADARLEDLKSEDDLVHAIGVYTGDQFSKEFITCEPKPEDWTDMVEFQRKNLARVSEDTLQTQIYRRETNRKLDALLRKYNDLQGQSAKENLDISVSLSTYRAGQFQVSLSYVIYGVGWHPSYEVRGDVQNEQVQLTGVGNVRQNTGEDWKNIQLSLSTARPAFSTVMPDLSPWYIRPRPPLFEAEAPEQRRTLGKEMPAAGAPAEAVVADIVQMETSVQFEIPYKLDVPSDNAYHRATVFTDTLKTAFLYTATPRLSPYAYLIGRTKNTTGAYWLPGKAVIFVGDTMVGAVSLQPVAPDEELTLSFGIDEAVSVEREELTRKEDESIFGNRKGRRFKDKITIVNNKAKAVNLHLIDQVPVSQHEDIKVTDVKFSEKPSDRNPDTGIVKWKLQLAPGQKKDVTIEFTVTHPADMEISGL